MRFHSLKRRLLALSCPHVPGWLPLDRFLWNLILGICMKICWETLNLVETRKKLYTSYENLWTFSSSWFFLILWLLVTLNCHKSTLCNWSGYQAVRRAEKASIVQTYQNVTLCIHWLSCWYTKISHKTYVTPVCIIKTTIIAHNRQRE